MTFFNETFLSLSVFSYEKSATVSKIIIVSFGHGNQPLLILVVMRGVNGYYQWVVSSAGN